GSTPAAFLCVRVFKAQSDVWALSASRLGTSTAGGAVADSHRGVLGRDEGVCESATTHARAERVRRAISVARGEMVGEGLACAGSCPRAAAGGQSAASGAQ